MFTVSDAPNYEQPWQTDGPANSSGSGAIIQTKQGLRVLTNAHVVENQVFVEVRRYGESTKYIARVEGVSHDCDLALLSVEEDGFFAGSKPLPLGLLPALTERVSVLGYPIGGDGISITDGIVSRIEMFRYAQTQRLLLAIQIDAAINSGNSGGPVIKNGKIVGVAFQSLEEGEGINYMIAAPVVRHFIKDVEKGVAGGFPHLGIRLQSLDSSAHRRSLKLSKQHGALVCQVAYGSSAWGKLKENDVLLEIGGAKVARDATVILRKGERVDYRYTISKHHVGDVLELKVWRSGREKTVSVTLNTPRYLVPEICYDVRPRYYLFGGLLFVPLTGDYLRTWGTNWGTSAPHGLVALYEHGVRTKDREEIVILHKVLADNSNQGYHDLHSEVISNVQGEPVCSLANLVQHVESRRSSFVRFETRDGTRVVLDRRAAVEAGQRILDRYGVPVDRSSDLE